MADEPKGLPTPTPRVRTITTAEHLNGSLKGQPTGTLPRIVDRPQVDELFKTLRPRFDAKAVILLSALGTEEINENGRRALKDGLHEFSMVGGDKLVIVAKRVDIVDVLKSLARRVGILDVTVVETIASGTRIGSAYWDLHHPRPVPPK